MGACLRGGFWSARCLSTPGSISSIHSARAQGVLSTSPARGLRRRKGTSSKRRSGRGRAIRSRSRVAYTLRRVLIGPALRSTAIAEERMGRLLALGVLSPDALSSVAYGPEAMMAILVLAGASELKLSLPIGAALAVLMLSVGLGYRQVVRAYPHGGGSYIVASDSLGRQWGLLAAAGLIVDYILTVAVSVAAGVAAVTRQYRRSLGDRPDRPGGDCAAGRGQPARVREPAPHSPPPPTCSWPRSR